MPIDVSPTGACDGLLARVADAVAPDAVAPDAVAPDAVALDFVASVLRRLASALLIGLLIGLPIGLWGSVAARAQHLSLQSFNAESGLANPSVGALAQDRAGFLYVGTEAGLFRYDGFRFDHLGAAEGLPANAEIETVRASPDGRIWVVTPDRVYLTGIGATLSATVAPPRDYTYAHRADTLGADLLLVRDGELFRIHPAADGTLSVQPVATGAASRAATGSATDFDTVYVDHGTVWLGCAATLCRLQDGAVAALSPDLGLPADRWTALHRDREGTLWLRSPSRIASLAKGASRFSVTGVPGGPGRLRNDAGRLELAEDAGGEMVTQGAMGLLVHERGRWVRFDRPGRTASIAVQVMLEGRDGSLWVGSKGRGLGRIVGLGTFENWSRADGLSDDLVWSMARDGAGTLWVATDLAVDALAERARAAVPREVAPQAAERSANDPALPHRAYALATSPRGWLWLGPETGPKTSRLIRMDPHSGATRQVAELPLIRLLTFDAAGALWIGTQNGLARIERPEGPAPVVDFVLPSVKGAIYAIRFDRDGDPWVLTQKTLFHRNPTTGWRPVLSTDPAGGYQTRQMAFAPDGTLWLGSFMTGITRLHLRDGVVISRDRLPSDHLASQVVELLIRDHAGRIWVGTDHGLDVTDGVTWRHLGVQDGLADNDLNENAAFIDDDATPWFGTSGGLSHLLDPGRVFASRLPDLDPVVTRVTIGDHDLPLSAVRSGPLHLRWSGDPLDIHFSSLAFRWSGSVRFRYRLRGVDRAWVETASHEARYPAPPSGKLVFEVMAVDPLHRIVSAPVLLVIKMRAPWWRTWPLYAALSILVVAAVVLLWRARVGLLLARQRQLQALVEERTREIEQARQILLKQATFDPLTGLLSRGAILEKLERAMAEAARTRSPLGVALLDLDYFKRVNDRFGHLGGDAVLREVGARLSASLRDTDYAGRYGGEELLLVLPAMKRDSFERTQALLVSLFEAPFVLDDQTTVLVTASMGVTWMKPGDEITAMIRRADVALYTAKRTGRDRVVFDKW